MEEFEDWWLLTEAFDDPPAQVEAAQVMNQQHDQPPSTECAGRRRRGRPSSSTFKESHVLVERKRRKGMNEYFSQLSALLPSSAAKSDKLKIVSETIDFIHSLEGELEQLSNKRGPGGLTTSSSHKSQVTESTVSQCCAQGSAMVNVRGLDVFITLCCANTISLLGLMKSAWGILEQQHLELVNGSVSTDNLTLSYYIHAKSKFGLSSVEGLQSALLRLTNKNNKNNIAE